MIDIQKNEWTFMSVTFTYQEYIPALKFKDKLLKFRKQTRRHTYTYCTICRTFIFRMHAVREA